MEATRYDFGVAAQIHPARRNVRGGSVVSAGWIRSDLPTRQPLTFWLACPMEVCLPS